MLIMLVFNGLQTCAVNYDYHTSNKQCKEKYQPLVNEHLYNINTNVILQDCLLYTVMPSYSMYIYYLFDRLAIKKDSPQAIQFYT